MNKIFFNGVELTESTILKTRQWYHDNAMKCINNVKIGKDLVYCDKEEYYKLEEQKALRYINGLNDYTFSFQQRAYYIQTGECIALLPN